MTSTPTLLDRALRLLLSVTLSASSLPLLPRPSRAAEAAFLAAPAGVAVNADLELLGCEIDSRPIDSLRSGDRDVHVMGIRPLERTIPDFEDELLPMTALLVEQGGKLECVELLLLDQSQGLPRLVIEVTTAADPQLSVRIAVDSNGEDGAGAAIYFSLRDRISGAITELGELSANESGGLEDRTIFGCISGCISTAIAPIGFWSLVSLVCCLVTAGITTITAGMTAGGSVAAASPILIDCLAQINVTTVAATISVMVNCIIGCF